MCFILYGRSDIEDMFEMSQVFRQPDCALTFPVAISPGCIRAKFLHAMRQPIA